MDQERSHQFPTVVSYLLQNIERQRLSFLRPYEKTQKRQTETQADSCIAPDGLLMFNKGFPRTPQLVP